MNTMTMDHGSYPRLLGDIGGTNARFAWQARAGDAPSDLATYAAADHASLLDAIRHYLLEHGKERPAQGAIGIANPVTGDMVRMTNHHWSFSIAALQAALGLQRLVVVNDFTALALSLPMLVPGDLHQIGTGVAVEGAPMALLGAGTGLGVSGLLRAADGAHVPVNGEGGHVSLAANDEMEAAVIQHLHRRFGHASAERALSGAGLVNLYEAVCALSGATARPLNPPDVIDLARGGIDKHCQDALGLFCSLLGGVAGNLALTLGARGGVYVGGGIAPRIVQELAQSQFRARFEGKGRFQSYLQPIPTFVIDTLASPALAGAARALDS